MKPGLETIQCLLEMLGNPHRGLRYIHVAGTNGKGATCAILDSILRAGGFRVCRYTSPHLVSINERFFVDGAPAASALLEEATAKVFPAIERLERESGIEVTFFESLTAVAFVLFARLKPDVVVLETGLGGRLDATNAVAPEDILASVITRIGLDHCDWLGRTLGEIAAEKAGIIKPGRPVVAAEMPQEALAVIQRIAAEKGSPVTTVSPDTPVPDDFALFGSFQRENARNALAAIAAAGLVVPQETIAQGLAGVVWPGRCQRIDRNGARFIVDGAHNPCAAEALVQALVGAQAANLRHRSLAARAPTAPFALVAGYCGDKDIPGHLAVMRSLAGTGWAVRIDNDRAAPAELVAERMREAGFDQVAASPSLPAALESAAGWSRQTGGTAIVCGSLFLAAEALLALDAFPWPRDRRDRNEQTLSPSPKS